MPLALVAALLGSLSIHAAALFLPDIDLSTAPELPPIVAELKPAPPPERIKAVEPLRPAAPPRPNAVRPKPAQQPAAVAATEPAAAGSAATPPPAAAEPPAPPAVRPLEPRLSANGSIRFAIYRGSQGLEIGRAEHRWAFIDGGYRLTAITETTGLAALFKPVRIELESRGRLAAFGLQPEQFTTRRNGSETSENAAFDWSSHQVTLARDGSHAPIREGAQDLLSFHYQLGYLAALDQGVSMGVVTGKKFERYNFAALGEEQLETPAGRFRTLHLRVQTDSTTELWLATEREMLPVKIRYTDRKGDSFEQVAIELGSP